MNTTFTFTGELYFPKPESKNPFVKDMTFTDKRTGKSVSALTMNFAVKSDASNMQFVTMFASEQTNGIMAHDTENQKVTVDWDARFDEDIISKIANYNKYTVDLSDMNSIEELRDAISSNDYSEVEEKYGVTSEDAAKKLIKEVTTRKVFLSQYDMIEYLAENLPTYKGKVMVTGRVSKRYYNGKYTDQFNIGSVYAVSDSTKNKLGVRMELFYNQNSIDKSDFKNTKKIYLNGFVEQYINSTEGNKYVPQQVILDASKYDLEGNDRHKKLWRYKSKYVDVKEKTYQKMVWEVRLINGAETVEFSEDMLTDSQREQVELGIKTVEDFRPRGAVFGERIKEYRLLDPKLEGDYADGLVDTEFTEKEFADLIYNPNKTVKMEEEVEKPKTKKTTKKPVEDELDDDDLF